MVSLELEHVLFRSHEWTIARSPVLARERVPLGLVHVQFRSQLQTMGLSAVRGGQQVPGVGDIRQDVREAPTVKWEQ